MSKRIDALSALKNELLKKKQALKTSDNSSSSSRLPEKVLEAKLTDQLDQLRKANSSKAALFMDYHTKSALIEGTVPTPSNLAKKARKDARYEEELALISSRESLERKAKLYDEKLLQMTKALTQGQQCDTKDSAETEESVIDFEAKAIDMLRNPQDYFVPEPTSPSVSSASSETDDDNEGLEKGWTEYVDSFGRTRKCLKSEVAHLKRLDREISHKIESDSALSADRTTSRGVGPEVPPPGYNGVIPEPTKSSKPTEYRRPGYDKDFVRYRDILGDEVRDHGVGYFAFSGDEEKRKRQLDYLASLRSETAKQKKPKTS